MLLKSMGVMLVVALVACSSGSGSGGSGGASGVGASGGGGGGGGSGGASGDRCATVCQALAGTCSGDSASCISGCHQGYSLFSNCASQLDAVYDCAATRPKSDFICDAQAQPQLSPGVCSVEVTAAQACVGG